MGPVVTLTTHSARAATGKRYAYYQLRWFGADGKRYSQNLGRVGELSKRQAEKLRQEKELELRQRPGLRSPGQIPGLKAFSDQYIESRKSDLAVGSIELYAQTIRYLIGHFGEERRIDQITRYDAREFKTLLSKAQLNHVNERKYATISARTVDQHIRNARTMFNRAVDDDLILYNPFDRMSGGLPHVEKDWHYVSMDEFAKLLAACPNPGWKSFLALCRLAGLRQMEALTLKWRDVDWGHNWLSVWAQKTKRRRLVPIAPELLPILQEAARQDVDVESPVVTGVTPENVWRDFGIIRKRAGTPNYAKWCHTLRKNRESDWISADFPFHVVVEWMGHSDEVARQHYLRVNESDMAAASQTRIAPVLTQKVTQIEESGLVVVDDDEPQVLKLADFMKKAGEGIRTLDVQLGKSVGRPLKMAEKLSISSILACSG
ncbi:MAG: hypothetical protein AMXMBFR47_23390 [Planctomycetota bacterium]